MTESKSTQLGVIARIKATDEEKEFAKAKAKPVTAAQIARWHRDAAVEIAESLQPFGYYNVVVDAELSSPKPEAWLATYVVTPGLRSQWREVNLSITGEGETESFLQSLLKNSVVRQGQEVDHSVYDEHKRTWVTRLYDAGYLDARFDDSYFSVDKKANAVDLNWTINTGPLYRFGDIKIDQDILRPSLVERYYEIDPGDVFDARRLIDLQLKLNDSNYFSAVSLNIKKVRPRTDWFLL